MSDIGQAETPMRDHVERFWQHLKTEYVRILIDLRRAHLVDSGIKYHWDSACFPDDVGKALVAERDALVKALEWYAQGGNNWDRGKRAKAALADVGSGGQGS